ncbi:MAG: DUF4214 domain-containing protein [Acidimicrobiales bacterium]
MKAGLGPLVAVIGAIMAAIMAVTPGTTPVAAQTASGDESVRCPVMTDSVDRLFLAYFNREPTGSEFRNWTSQYRSGAADLEAIASELGASEEFRTRYGNLDDGRFVELVYRNVLRRAPSEADKDFWETNLASGYERGPMMLAFSESEEFIRRSGTTTPLAGFLRWYPEGSHWYCGVGPRNSLGIKPLEDPTVYADFMFINTGDSQSPVGITTVLNGSPHLEVSRGSLPPGFSDYKWGGQFGGDGNYGSALSISAGARTSWVVVFYPSSVGDQRLGWQIEP